MKKATDPDLSTGIVIDAGKLDGDRLDRSLKEIDLRVKRIDWWIKCLGIPGSILAFIIAIGSTWSAYTSWIEAERVNVSLSLIPQILPRTKVVLSAVLKNDSKRQVTIAMIGVRLWQSEWTDRDTVVNQPGLLVFSDTRVSDCPKDICDKTSAKTALTELALPLVLAAGETDTLTLGPYLIPPEYAANGIWVQGWAFTREYDNGSCVVVRPPAVVGAFPYICEASRLNDPQCDQHSECKAAATPGLFVSPKTSP